MRLIDLPEPIRAVANSRMMDYFGFVSKRYPLISAFKWSDEEMEVWESANRGDFKPFYDYFKK